jgi:DNA-binding CsgD family transcriptional regulator/N-acetylneuraminic acid mutarotase
MPIEEGQPLSERELEITGLVTEGLTNREIAERIFLSPNTVKVHLRNIFTKTGVASRTELSMLAVQEGWVVVVDSTDTSTEHLDYDGHNVEEPTPTEIIPWPWQRWGLFAGFLVGAITILILPSLPIRQVASSGPGLIFGPGQETSGFDNFDPDGRWEEQTPLPVRRAGMGTASLSGKAHIIGGINAEGVTNRHDIFDIETNQWSVGNVRPEALGNISAVSLHGNIFVPGGCDAGWQPSESVHQYIPDTDSWISSAPLPTPLCAYALAVYEDEVYILGGWNGDMYTASAFTYNPDSDSWRMIASPSVNRGFGGAAVLADRIYYVGGYDGRRELDICEVYDPAVDEWDVCPSMLQPRGGIGVTSTAGRIYVTGGGWDSFLGFNERFSLESGQWTVVDTPIVGEWRNVGVFTWDRSLYVVGGWSGTDFLNRTYSVEVMPWRVFMPGTFRAP